MADPSSNTVALTGNALIDGLTQGSEWTNLGAGPIPVITYSLNINNNGLDNANPTPDPEGGTWDATWIATAAAAFQAWENVANIDFQQQAVNNNEYYFQSTADLALTRTGDDLFQGSFDLPAGPIVAVGIAPDPFLVDTLLGFNHASPPVVWPNPEGDIAFDNTFQGFQDQYLVAGGWGFHTFIHEIGHALGLKHSFDDGGNGRPTFTDLGIVAFEDPLWTVMTYDPGNPPPLAATGLAAAPMPLDILAIQHIYGANETYNDGDTTYNLADPKYEGVVWTIWDAGGNDTMDASGLGFGITLDLRPGSFTNHGANSTTAIAYKHATIENFVENAIGTAFNDTIIGNDAVNTVRVHGPAVQYSAVRYGNEAFVYDQVENRDGADSLVDVESLNFAANGETVSVNDLATALEYTASYEDLMGAFGTDGAAAFQHFKVAGAFEGRGVSFSGLAYIASYEDLINAFGASADSGAWHYIVAGRTEGRGVSFDGLEYIASYEDLIGAFGVDERAGATHYIVAGHTEGRQVTFDGLHYVASYGDLVTAFGLDSGAATIHYITTGHLEGRQVSFDGLEYIASYEDLINAFGTDEQAGTAHYVGTGYGEGRQVSFDGLEYIASYEDLINAFGTDEHAGTSHYIATGHVEGRQVSFDGLEYIASYGDLIVAFGANRDAGDIHYITTGHSEGRVEDFNPQQYLDNYEDLQLAFGSDLEAATLHFIQAGYFEGRTDDILA